MGELCVWDGCARTLIHGYNKYGEPLCYGHFNEHIEEVLADAEWVDDYRLEDALLDNEGVRDCAQ